MKIAIATQTNSDDTLISEHFGRTAFFCIFDTETRQKQWISNQQNKQAAKGAGQQTAGIVANAGANLIVLGGKIGPKAMDIIKQVNIEVKEDLGEIPLQQVIDSF